MSDIVQAIINFFKTPGNALQEGINILRDASGNIFSIIRNAEDGVISIIKEGEEIFKDTEQNFFKTIQDTEQRFFTTLQAGELTLEQLGALSITAVDSNAKSAMTLVNNGFVGFQDIMVYLSVIIGFPILAIFISNADKAFDTIQEVAKMLSGAKLSLTL